MAEWTYNTSEHSSTGFTPFELVYGRPPPPLLPYKHGTTAVQAVDDELRNKEHIIALASENRQVTVAVRKNLKLASRYFGPFQIIQRIGIVTYKLDLPKESKVYPVFHVSCLKKKIRDRVNPNPRLPPVMEDGTMAPELEGILDRRLKKKGNRAGVDLLVHWKGTEVEDATLIDGDELRHLFPELVDELF